MRKLYPKGWLEYHPYTRTDEVDYYYTDIANRIYQILHKCLQDDEDWEEKAAFTLAAWFEDIISQTGIWQTFTEECENTHGTRLPFYPIGKDYYPDEVNIEDIRFLLWHSLQQRDLGIGRIINPENPGIEMAAGEVYLILSKEYETAPENERMQAYFRVPESSGLDYHTFRKKVEWFHYYCYINSSHADVYNEQCMELIENIEKDTEKEYDFSHLDLVFYSMRINNALTYQNCLAGLTSLEYISRILKRNSTSSGPWGNVEVFPHNYYFCLKEKGSTFIAKTFGKNKKEMAIEKDSLSDISKIKPGKSILCANLVRYGDTWQNNGMLTVYEGPSSELIDIMVKTSEKVLHEKERQIFKMFTKASQGKLCMFFKGSEALKDFLTKGMKLKLESKDVPPSIEKQAILVIASPHSGLHVETELTQCICSPDNPFYDKKEASDMAHEFIFSVDSIPYDLSCALQELNLLPDARINSTKGEEHGRKFLHDNARFLTDYFFRKNWKKDYADSELRQWIHKKYK